MAEFSSIPAACDALVAHLHTIAATYTDPVALAVIDGDIGADTPPCYVLVGGATDWKNEPAGLGNFRRDESYVLDAVIQWFEGGPGTEVASRVRASAFAVLGDVVAALIADPTLTGTVRLAQLIGGPAMEQGTTAVGGWSVVVGFHIQCQVQLEQ